MWLFQRYSHFWDVYSLRQGVMSKMVSESIKGMNTDELRKDMYYKIDKILAQVVKTNGRVNKLEAWKDQVMGGLKVTLVIVALAGFLFKIGWLTIGA